MAVHVIYIFHRERGNFGVPPGLCKLDPFVLHYETLVQVNYHTMYIC